MTQFSNQFSITNEVGALTLLQNDNIFSGLVDANEAGTLAPGNAVVLKDVASKVPKFELATALTDKIFGFVPYDIRVSAYVANEPIKAAFSGCVMVMVASAAIAAGAKLQYDPATNKVATGVAPNTVIGISLDKAAADNDQVRVLILTPGNADQDLSGLTATVLELNRADDSNEIETIDSGDAISVTKFNTVIDNTTGGAGAITLAACPATMIGKIKTIRMGVDGGDVTLELPNVQGGSAGTTATFSAVGQELILCGSQGGKWTVLKEFGVALV